MRKFFTTILLAVACTISSFAQPGLAKSRDDGFIKSRTGFIYTDTTSSTGGVQDETIWYFSNNGDDDYDGHSSSFPKATITELNTITLNPGDQVLFEKGDTFSDAAIVVDQSGTYGNPIIFSSYGTGPKPIISGFTTLSGWSNEGGGIYSKAINPGSSPNMVTIDGVNTAMGRYPDNTWFVVDSYNAV